MLERSPCVVSIETFADFYCVGVLLSKLLSAVVCKLTLVVH